MTVFEQTNMSAGCFGAEIWLIHVFKVVARCC